MTDDIVTRLRGYANKCDHRGTKWHDSLPKQQSCERCEILYGISNEIVRLRKGFTKDDEAADSLRIRRDLLSLAKELSSGARDD